MIISRASKEAIKSAIKSKQKTYDKLKAFYDSGDKIRDENKALFNKLSAINSMSITEVRKLSADIEENEKAWKKWINFDYENLLQIESDIQFMKNDLRSCIR